ncbi:hypothetical protein AB0B07_35430 [Streptomyces sioyaensis]|uniref:hypothetical protein n=1 Tax=Streptomyces sioyaensis TaxID=67364 RepID=UPI00340AC74A
MEVRNRDLRRHVYAEFLKSLLLTTRAVRGVARGVHHPELSRDVATRQAFEERWLSAVRQLLRIAASDHVMTAARSKIIPVVPAVVPPIVSTQALAHVTR